MATGIDNRPEHDLDQPGTAGPTRSVRGRAKVLGAVGISCAVIVLVATASPALEAWAIAPVAALVASLVTASFMSGRKQAGRAERLAQLEPRGLGEWRGTERRPGEEEATFRLLFEANPEPMWVYDLETLKFLQVNQAAVSHYGYSEDEFLGMRVSDLHPGDESQAPDLTCSHPGNDFSGPCKHVRRDGRIMEVLLAARRLEFDGRQAALVVGFDVTEQKALERQLTKQAFHDALTGLANRALFHDRVDQALLANRRSGAGVVVLFLDVDGFKTVNDSLGHDAGDDLLVGVAGRLRNCVRPGDTVARLGGDEFAILLDGRAQEAGEAVAQRVLEVLREPFAVSGREVFVSASVGIAVGCGNGTSTEAMLREADAAMYAAKTAGKGRYQLFAPAMHARALERLALGADLRRALDGDQLILEYQPLVRLQTGTIDGVEALVRWAHPTRGLLPPMQFIPLAEETGLIRPLGRWVLQEACGQTCKWQRWFPGRPPLSVSVNLSVRQLQQPDLVDDVARALERSGLHPSSLVLEITESVMMNEADEVVSRLIALKNLGVRLAVDDFGTGYSSLSYLQRLPVDIIKIDKSFLEGVSERAGNAPTLVRSILNIGQSLRLEMVAEGVEDTTQLGELQAAGCQVGQGFYFAHPLSPPALEALLSSPGTAAALALGASSQAGAKSAGATSGEV